MYICIRMYVCSYVIKTIIKTMRSYPINKDLAIMLNHKPCMIKCMMGSYNIVQLSTCMKIKTAVLISIAIPNFHFYGYNYCRYS